MGKEMPYNTKVIAKIQAEEGGCRTPGKETKRLMKAERLTKSQKEKIRKPLLLGNVMAQKVRETKDQTSRGYMKAVHRVISGKNSQEIQMYKTACRQNRLMSSQVSTWRLQIPPNTAINKKEHCV